MLSSLTRQAPPLRPIHPFPPRPRPRPPPPPLPSSSTGPLTTLPLRLLSLSRPLSHSRYRRSSSVKSPGPADALTRSYPRLRSRSLCRSRLPLAGSSPSLSHPGLPSRSRSLSLALLRSFPPAGLFCLAFSRFSRASAAAESGCVPSPPVWSDSDGRRRWLWRCWSLVLGRRRCLRRCCWYA